MVTILEIKPRLVTDIHVGSHSQFPEKKVEKPIPHGVVGITVFERGEELVELLDEEICVWGRAHRGANSNIYTAAIMSISDALSLIPSLKKALREGESACSTLDSDNSFSFADSSLSS